MRLYLSPNRYYSVAIQRDLFGRPVLISCWGGRWSRRGGIRTEPYTPEKVREIHKRRLAHGYSLAERTLNA